MRNGSKWACPPRCFIPRRRRMPPGGRRSWGLRKLKCFSTRRASFHLLFSSPSGGILDGAGVRVKSFHPYTSALEGLLLFSDYDRRTRDALDQYERYFEGAASLGARYCTFHGERDMPVVFQEETTARLAETYHRLCERAARCGMDHCPGKTSPGANPPGRSICVCCGSGCPSCAIRWISNRPIAPAPAGRIPGGDGGSAGQCPSQRFRCRA